MANWVEKFSMKYEVAGYLTEGASPRSLASMRSGGGGRGGDAAGAESAADKTQ
jgi:hypothetical protein